MKLALDIADCSTCLRLKVGSVLTSVDYRYVFAVGYNGNASGLSNKCDSEEPGHCGCLHSEQNLIANCTIPRYVEKVLFVSHSPCVMCAKLLINLGGVKKIFYKEEYRKPEAREILKSVGIPLIQFDQYKD